VQDSHLTHLFWERPLFIIIIIIIYRPLTGRDARKILTPSSANVCLNYKEYTGAITTVHKPFFLTTRPTTHADILLQQTEWTRLQRE
jgi:hypothetical protein